MTKKSIVKKIDDLEEQFKNDTREFAKVVNDTREFAKVVNDRVDNSGRLFMTLLDYLGLDVQKEKVVKSDFLSRDVIVTKYTIVKAKKIKKAKK